MTKEMVVRQKCWAVKLKFFHKKGHSENLVCEICFSSPQTRRQVFAHEQWYHHGHPEGARVIRNLFLHIVINLSLLQRMTVHYRIF